MSLNIESNRATRKYPLKIQFMRILWGSIGSFIFRLIPRPLYMVRSMVLRLFGATIGRHVHISNTVKIYFPWNLTIGDWSSIGDYAYIYSLGPIYIGSKATISHRAHLCSGTHDYNSSILPLITQPINIGDQVWVCADAFVCPNISIGVGAVVGSRSVVTKNVEDWVVVAGNPAKKIKNRELIDVGCL